MNGCSIQAAQWAASFTRRLTVAISICALTYVRNLIIFQIILQSKLMLGIIGHHGWLKWKTI